MKSLKIITASSGSAGGTPLLLIPSSPLTEEAAQQLVTERIADSEVMVVSGALPDLFTVETFSEEVMLELERLGLKKIGIVGVGVGSTVAQELASRGERFVRRLVLVDGTTRVEPGSLQRFVDKLERMLPLGLPLRSSDLSFDSRAFLHRVRCPVLVLTSPEAGEFEQEQAKIFAKYIPNCWSGSLLQRLELKRGRITAELLAVLEEFSLLAPKRPQKNLEARAGRG